MQGFEFSVFEVNIRFVGGMLACYALTGDQVLIVYCVFALVLQCTASVIFLHCVEIAKHIIIIKLI